MAVAAKDFKLASPGPAPITLRQQYETLRSSLVLERSSFDVHYRELAEFLFPRRTRFQVTDRNRGDRRSSNIINSTPRFAALTLQSGLHAGLTSPARPWMRLTTPDPAMAEIPAIKEWLHEVTNRMLTVFLRSNLYNGLPTLYGDVGVFATGAMGLFADQKDMLRAYSYPIGSYALGLDARGLVTTFLRDYVRTVRQLVAEFAVDAGDRTIHWERLSAAVRNAWDTGNYEQAIEITWLVTPNPDADPGKLYAKDAMPFRSCHFERTRPEEGAFLRESGFKTFPVVVPRWDVTAEDTYGTDCPAMTALGDIKGLQLLERRKAQAIDKALNPALVGPSSLRTQKTSLLPGDITYSDDRVGMQGLRPIHEVRLEGLREVVGEIGRHEDRIERAFYADLWRMLTNSDQVQPITAREVVERHEEKMVMLGPVLERMNDELLDPMVDRTFGIMLEAGAIPDPPDELVGVGLRVEYLSILAQAQRLVGVGGQDRFLQSTMSLVSAFPNARHKVNVYQAINDYADMLGVNPKLVYTDEEAKASADAEAQQQAAAAAAVQAQKLGAAAASLGKVPIDTNTDLAAAITGSGTGSLAA